MPALVPCYHMLGARVGRCLPLPRQHALAFAMGTHSRLAAAAGGSGDGGEHVVKTRSRRLEVGTTQVSTEGNVKEHRGCAFVGMPVELVRKIVDLCQGWPEGHAGELDGVVRLVGGGRLRLREAEAS